MEVCDTHPWCPSPRSDVAAGRSITSDLEPATLPKTGTSSFSEEDLAPASMARRRVLSVLKDFASAQWSNSNRIKALILIGGKAQVCCYQCFLLQAVGGRVRASGQPPTNASDSLADWGRDA